MNRQRGFTLIELVTAIAIFSILAGMLFQMIRNGLDIWSIGEGQRASLEKGSSVLEEIAADLRMVRADSPHGAPGAPVRMVSDYGFFDLNLDDATDSVLQRLRFVRSCPEERFDEWIRRAGDMPGGKGASSDVSHDANLIAAAPGGLAEVAYATVAVSSKTADIGLLTLYRLFRTPIGGEGSLFEDQLYNEPKALAKAGVPLCGNVLYLGFEFWSRDTRSWEDVPNGGTGPLTSWDSTRALLLEPDDSFNSFALARSAASLEETGDDVFPRRVRITLVLERDQDEAAVMTLTRAVTTSATSLIVDTLKPLPARKPARAFVKVEGEWVEWNSKDGHEIKVTRGVRSTGPVPHAIGAKVHVGKTFQKIVEIPVFREDWNDG